MNNQHILAPTTATLEQIDRSQPTINPQAQRQNLAETGRNKSTYPNRPRPSEQPIQDCERLLRHLHRGGLFAHLWTDAGNQSHWFRVNSRSHAAERNVPAGWHNHNVYFSVHPLTRIPPHNSSGNRDRHYISSQLPYIAAINALFAEYDGKDFVWPWECSLFLPQGFHGMKPLEQRKWLKAAKEEAFYRSPARYKARARLAIDALPFPPSVLLDSGGGYHAYWLLRQSVPVDESNRTDLQLLQQGWVRMVGADIGASDLRRVLRLPGTANMKSGFGAQHPQVVFVKADFSLLYALQELEEAVNDWQFANRAAQAKQTLAAQVQEQGTTHHPNADLRARFNQNHKLVDLLVAHGYTVSFRYNGGTRLARPGRDKHHSSVVVFPARPNGTPELSIHFSTSDDLYSEEYLDQQSGQVRRRAHDAFHLFVLLTHSGDWSAAYAAAHEMLDAEKR